MKMSDSISEVIDKNRSYLVDHIEVKNSVLWDKLIGHGLFTSPDVQYIKVSISLNPCFKGIHTLSKQLR